jgi:hypothetical protein
MYQAEWYASGQRHEVKGSADDIRRELVGSIEPIDLAQLLAWMRTATVGESHGTIVDGYGWTVARVG